MDVRWAASWRGGDAGPLGPGTALIMVVGVKGHPRQTDTLSTFREAHEDDIFHVVDGRESRRISGEIELVYKASMFALISVFVGASQRSKGSISGGCGEVALQFVAHLKALTHMRTLDSSG